jgi:NitT/TauT family transport system ATP-binding protein
MTQSADITVSNVTLRYGSGAKTVLALDGLSLDVKPNEFAVIVGPSGCGKSSLLYLIAGLEDRTGGTISVGGKAVAGPGPDRGMVFQSYTLFPWLTVAQNVEYGPRRRPRPSAASWSITIWPRSALQAFATTTPRSFPVA